MSDESGIDYADNIGSEVGCGFRRRLCCGGKMFFPPRRTYDDNHSIATILGIISFILIILCGIVLYMMIQVSGHYTTYLLKHLGKAVILYSFLFIFTIIVSSLFLMFCWNSTSMILYPFYGGFRNSEQVYIDGLNSHRDLMDIQPILDFDTFSTQITCTNNSVHSRMNDSSDYNGFITFQSIPKTASSIEDRNTNEGAASASSSVMDPFNIISISDVEEDYTSNNINQLIGEETTNDGNMMCGSYLNTDVVKRAQSNNANQKYNTVNNNDRKLGESSQMHHDKGSIDLRSMLLLQEEDNMKKLTRLRRLISSSKRYPFLLCCWTIAANEEDWDD